MPPLDIDAVARATFMLVLVFFAAWTQRAQAIELHPSETVEYVTDSTLLGSDRLETTVYRPGIPGPLPLIVLNHGNDPVPDKHMQQRWRPGWVAEFFVRQGYMVIVPMRRGYAGSSGTFAYNCNPVEFGDRAADDVEAAIRYYVRRHEARADQVLVIGQSQGGWVTLAYASKYSDARGIVNMDGGIAYPDPRCRAGWEDRLIDAGRVIGARARLPSLWIYAHDDQIFPPEVSSPFFDAYHRAGANARLVTVPYGGHSFMWGSYRNEEQWRSTVERFIAQVGLPVSPTGIQ